MRSIGRLALVLLLGLGLTPSAHAATGESTVTANGRTLTVAPANELDPSGQAITVTGRGYDDGTEGRRAQGIYLALCVDNGPGKAPSPCVGGVDMSGGAGSSVWISNNPPDYGKDLVKPFGPGGSFSFTITVKRKDEFADCAILTCAVFTRSDHTASGDRTQDVGVPITWRGEGGPGPGDPGGITKHKRKVSVTANGVTGLAVGESVYYSSARAGAVSVIDSATYEASGAPIKLGNLTSQLAVHKNLLYAVNRGVVDGKPSVSIVDTKTRRVLATVPVGAGPNGIAVDAHRGTVFVANGGANSVSVINAQHQVTATVPVGSGPDGVAVDPATGNAYVANASGDSVSVIDASTNRVTATILVPGYPRSVAIADGVAYVVSQAAGTVSTLDTRTNKVTGEPIGVGSTPARVTADAGLLYLSQPDVDQVTVIDQRQRKIVERIEVGKPGPVAVGPAGLVHVVNGKENKIEVLTRAVSPTITKQPGNQTADMTATVSLTATATGTPKPEAVWQNSIDGGQSWADLREGTTKQTTAGVESTLSFAATKADNGRRYRVVFTNEAGETTSASAVLTVRIPQPTTTTPPPSTVSTPPTSTPSTQPSTQDIPATSTPPVFQPPVQRLANTGVDGVGTLLLAGLGLLALGGVLMITLRRRRTSR